MIELRTILAAVTNPDKTEDWVVQEPDGTLSHEHRHLDKPSTVIDLEKTQHKEDLEKLREILYSEKFSVEEKTKTIPPAISLGKDEKPEQTDMDNLPKEKMEGAK